MKYSQQYYQLNRIFRDTQADGIPRKEKHMQVSWNKFHSDYSFIPNPTTEDSIAGVFRDSSENIDRNVNFRYPVFFPDSRSSKRSAILLLHGLNERTWEKYVPWAYTLASLTKQPVILFPIAYHMNRSPDSWHNPRKMLEFVNRRRKSGTQDPAVSVVNIALSERIRSHPERFFLSGYQAANDIIALANKINLGLHPGLEKGTQLHFFGYSIGALLAQVLLVANPLKLFSRSKAFLFCGGSVFEGMKGISRFILDDSAFLKMAGFYRDAYRDPASAGSFFADLLTGSTLGKAFHLLLSREELALQRKRMFHKLNSRLRTICLTKDTVMPADEVKKSLSGTQVEEIDFPFPYTHENPFPLKPVRYLPEVDESFEKVFMKIADFLR